MNEREVFGLLHAIGFDVGSDGVVADDRGGYCQIIPGGLRVPVPGRRDERMTVRFGEISMLSTAVDGQIVLITPDREEREIVLRRRPGYSAEEGFESYEMPMTVSALCDVLPSLYEGLDRRIYYDELTEREMIDMSLFGREGGVVPITDSIVSVYHDDLERKLSARGFVGKRYPSMQVRDEALTVVMHDNRRNLFRDWVESLEWDGTPRVRTLFQNLFGGTAPSLREVRSVPTEDEARYLGDVAEAWIIGAVERMYKEAKHEIVPVFIGSQGIGKGTALKYLAGQDRWYRDTTVDFKDPQKFLDSVRGAIIVELGEGIQLQGDDQGLLKAFVSQSSDHLRKAYAHYDEVFPRHFILAASSNTDVIFKDPTGARRFFPVFCDPDVQAATGTVIPTNGRPARYQQYVEQIWAEALAMYRDGRKWYITDRRTLSLAHDVQQFCSEERIGTDAISEWLNDPANGYTEVGCRVSRTDILVGAFGVDLRYIDANSNRMYNQWKDVHPGWTPINAKIRGKSCRGFERVLAPNAVTDRRTFTMVSADELEARDELMADDGVRGRFYRYLLSHPGDVGETFHAEDLDEEEIEAFLNEGYIYDEGGPGTGRMLCIGVREEEI